MENTTISLHFQCSGDIHGTSSASNTIKNINKCLHLQCSGGIHGTSSASNTMENIIISLHLQCSGGIHMVPPAPQNMFTFTFGTSSAFIWLVVFSLCSPPFGPPWYRSSTSRYRSRCPGHRESSHMVQNDCRVIDSLIHLRCSGGIHSTSSGANTMENTIVS